MARLFYIAFVLLPLSCFAQFSISGRVLNADNTQPVTGACLFLNSTFMVTTTNTDGLFTFNNVKPGQYTLVVSITGCKAYQQGVMVTDKMLLPDIALSLKAITLNHESGNPDADRDKNVQLVKGFLLGKSPNTGPYEITNPEILSFDYDPLPQILTARSMGFLKIVNNVLGYRVNYLLNNFSYYTRGGLPEMSGYFFFETLDGPASQNDTWKANRLNIYLGSTMQFFRSALNNRSRQTGFTVFKPYYDTVTDKKTIKIVKKFRRLSNVDMHDMIRPTVINGRFAITFTDSLFVTFSEKGDKAADPLNNAFATIITLISPHLYFDSNGVISNPDEIISKGYWQEHPLPEWFPYDYEPQSP